MFLGLLELSYAVWRLNRREFQLAVIGVADHFRLGEDAIFASAVALAVGAGAMLYRRIHRPKIDPLDHFDPSVPASAAGDNLALR